MPFQIIQHDLLKMRTDVIVNATDQFYSGGGGVDHAIHQAAGPELTEACGFLGRLHLGEVKATEGYNLPVKFIFHTSGPRWRGGSHEELVLLGNCYRNSIHLAREKKCTSIAFPLISSKGKHFPKEVALTVAIDAIRSALEDHDDIDIYLVVFGSSIKTLSETLFPEIQQIIEEDYRPSTLQRENPSLMIEEMHSFPQIIQRSSHVMAEEGIETLIDELLNNPTQKNLDKVPIDENFGQLLTQILKSRNLKHSDIYDELGMSNVGFWKILTGKNNPSKLTVFGIAVALKLSSSETNEMLLKAGYAINPSSLQDVILAGLIKKKIYDRFAIDTLLYALDLQLLPGAIID